MHYMLEDTMNMSLKQNSVKFDIINETPYRHACTIPPCNINSQCVITGLKYHASHMQFVNSCQMPFPSKLFKAIKSSDKRGV